MLACLLASKPAFAQRDLWRDWYGWQLMAADVAAGALVLAPVDDDARGATVGVGMTALFMNGAFVNMPNHNPKRASLSLVRLPAFLLGRLAGFGLGHGLCKQTGCRQPMQTWGGIIALGGVVLWDWVTAVRPAPSPYASSDPLPPARLQALVGARLHPEVHPPLLGVAVDRRSSSAVKLRLASAFTLSRICSGRLAPMTTLVMRGSRSTQASAICARRLAARLRELVERPHPGQVLLAQVLARAGWPRPAG